MEVKGYKAFTKERKNEYGKTFEEGKTYTISAKELVFGQHGFHFCKRLEDCLRYFAKDDIDLAQVTGLEEVRETNDYITDSYGICIARKIRIDRFIPREEIVAMYDNPTKIEWYNSIYKFLSSYTLTAEEIARFESAYCENTSILQAILYYQRHIQDAYHNMEKVQEKQKQLIKTKTVSGNNL